MTFYPTYSSFKKSEYVTLRTPEFLEKYKDIQHDDSVAASDLVCVEGRIHSIRKVSKVLYFIDIVQDDTKLQVVSGCKPMGLEKDEFNEIYSNLYKNDHVSVWGFPLRTKAGEISLRANKPLKIISPCLQMPVDRLEHRDKINSNRVLNYLVNSETRKTLQIKNVVVQSIRNFLSRDGFLEVQTPILAGLGTGANAEPFVTNSRALDDSIQCQLRVAPELWLKKLVISGFDKVFEIGQNFRNEGIDGTHNPEFLTCEFYRSHTDLSQLMRMTEDLFREISTNLRSNHKLPATMQQLLESEAEFEKYEFIPTLESKIGIPLPDELSLERLIEYYEMAKIPIPQQRSPQNLLDNLSGLFLEPLSETEDGGKPVFIYNQPAIMSPLAKSSMLTYHDREYEISLRFELFIQGKEYVNSYEEENSPFEQLRKFQGQVESKEEFEDNELLIPDWEYVKSMEYGLPPTGGWGCGIDRLTMLFSGSERIEQVLPFGSLKDVVKQ